MWRDLDDEEFLVRRSGVSFCLRRKINIKKWLFWLCKGWKQLCALKTFLAHLLEMLDTAGDTVELVKTYSEERNPFLWEIKKVRKYQGMGICDGNYDVLENLSGVISNFWTNFDRVCLDIFINSNIFWYLRKNQNFQRFLFDEFKMCRCMTF